MTLTVLFVTMTKSLTKEAEQKGFQKALKVMWELTKKTDKIHRASARPFLQEFAEIHHIELK